MVWKKMKLREIRLKNKTNKHYIGLNERYIKQ